MQHEHHVPVTALTVHREDQILAGEGNYLCVYDRSSGKPFTRTEIFDNQAVHGVILSERSPERGVVWGGQFLRVFRLDARANDEFTLSLEKVLTTNDWILDAAIHPDSFQIAVVTAHNALWLLADSYSRGERDLLFEKIIAGSNSILYSADVKWLSHSHCLIASGTAFGDVVLWSATFHEHEGKTIGQSQIHHNFPAHEGSIFGVQISSWTTLPDIQRSTRVLATCSDDRNIKLWDISNLETVMPTLPPSQRDTGFGSRLGADEALSPRCLAKAMGHLSRIWHLRFTYADTLSTLSTVTSFGEDASTITWQIEPNDQMADLPYTLVKSRTTNAHLGKNIWSTALIGRGDIITGGADGAIALLRPPTDSNGETEVSSVPLDSISNVDRFKTYCFLAKDILLASTEAGRLILIHISNASDTTITSICDPLPGLKGYSVVQSVAGLGFAAGTDGSVYMYSHQSKQLTEIASLDRKVAGLFSCETNTHAVLLVTTVGSTSAELIQIPSDNSTSRTNVTLSLPERFIVTSFAILPYDSSEHALLGSRTGSLALFTIESSSSSVTQLTPHLTVPVGKEAITSLHSIPSPDFQQRTSHIFSTARDSTLSIHTLTATPSSLHLNLTHQLPLPFGPNIEGLHIDASRDRCRLWGFHSTAFIVYDAVAQREILRVDCGGAHRTWAFQPGERDGEGTFVWTKAGRVFRKRQAELPWEVVKNGGHGREIKAAAISPSPARASGGSGQLVATGAEDTDIRISRLVVSGGDDGIPRMKGLQTLRKHNTGIQHLQWSRDGRLLFSSGGFEELFVWRVSSSVPLVDIGVVCASKHPRSGMSDLRIMGFDARENVRREEVNESFRIVMAYSDSTVRDWQYMVAADSWECKAKADYLTACLTQVIRFPGARDHTTDFLITATDGHIAQWTSRGEQSLRWTARRRVHQNSILASAATTLLDGSTLLATGGDDGAVAFTCYDAGSDEGGVTEPGRSLRLPRAHAAAVTGLAFVASDGAEGGVRVMSVGLDQRVKTWTLTVANNATRGAQAVSAKLMDNVFTAVADVSALEVWGEEEGKEEDMVGGGGDGVLVCGVGVDIRKSFLRPARKGS